MQCGHTVDKVKKMNLKRYSELIRLPTFKERFDYVKTGSIVGYETFGGRRYLVENFYQHSQEWKSVRDYVIIRDEGCDLAILDRVIYGPVFVHHLNPITVEDILNRNVEILNPEFLVCCSRETHNALHYGDASSIVADPVVRIKNDTILW